MKLPERHNIVRAAQVEFLQFWTNFYEKYMHHLTMFEFISILTTLVQSLINVSIRTERESREQRGPESRRQADGD